MTIQELEYFKIICREKSITKAARQLYITPQGLSKTLKNLESELQTTLLNRNTSGVTLTETGQYLCDHLDTLLTDYYALRHGIREITQRQNHEIDLLSAYGILRLVTPDCITASGKNIPTSASITGNIRTSKWSASLPPRKEMWPSPSVRRISPPGSQRPWNSLRYAFWSTAAIP